MIDKAKEVKEILGEDAHYMLAQFMRVDENTMSAKVEICNASPMMLLNVATSMIDEIAKQTNDSHEDVVLKILDTINDQDKVNIE
jgi:hypothetical protein